MKGIWFLLQERSLKTGYYNETQECADTVLSG